MKISSLKAVVLGYFQRDYWIRINTEYPSCTYYFGPFNNEDEARTLQVGYIEDLVQEGAQNISVKIEKKNPQKLTIYEY